MEGMVAELSRTLQGWYNYYKHAEPRVMKTVDGWTRMRLRSILRKRLGLRGCGRGRDHRRWRNRYFAELGRFCLVDAQSSELASFRNGANH